jgi:hypothetical protein
MNEKENVVNYPNIIENRVMALEFSMTNISQTLIRLENKMDKSFGDVDQSMIRLENKMDKGFDDFRSELKTHFRWTMGLMAGLYLTMVGSLITVLTVVIKFSH